MYCFSFIVIFDRFLVESSNQRTDELDKTLLSIEGSVEIALQVSALLSCAAFRSGVHYRQLKYLP